MKSFSEWKQEKETAIQENTVNLGISSPSNLGVANSLEEGKKKKMFGDELTDNGGELAKASEPKDKDIDMDDDDDADDECGKDDLTPAMMKKCGKTMKKKMKKEGCGDDDDMDDDDMDMKGKDMDMKKDTDMGDMMMQKKKMKKKSKKEGYDPNETPEEFFASLSGQLRGPQKSNKDGISEYLEDSLIEPQQPEAGEVGSSPFTRIGELGGNFNSQEWEEIKELAFGVRENPES